MNDFICNLLVERFREKGSNVDQLLTKRSDFAFQIPLQRCAIRLEKAPNLLFMAVVEIASRTQASADAEDRQRVIGPSGLERSMNTPLNDGLLRLGRQDLAGMQLLHLISGLDDDAEPDVASPVCGGAAPLVGYTEWVSAKEPRVTLGWDWHLDDMAPTPRVVRLGLPRTNVQLLDGADKPLPWDESLHVLASFIDTFDWNTPAFEAVCQRYA